MANKKISQLDPIGTIDVNQDSIPIVDYSENITKRTNLANIGQRVLEANTTTNLAEGSNLYFTNTRVYTKVKASLLAGSNTSITFDDALQTITIASQGNVQSVNTKTGAVVLTTTDISEGTNEYHTSARVRAVILTGLSTATNAIISATDTVLSAFGKLQAQITANLSTLTSHTSNTSNPHATTKAQVGLSNVDNTSDVNKPISTATQTALNAKQDTLVSGTNIKTIEGQSLLGVGNIDLTKSDVGLGNVDNTSDANKPVSTATQTALNGKENTITAGTTVQYYRGDKTFQTLDKTAVGLGNVANVDTTNASNISSGTLDDARLSSAVTTQGNTFNGASQLVKLDASAKLPAVDGSNLTNLPIPSTPTLAQVTNAGNTTTNAINTGLITTTTSAVGNMFVVNGANNTSLISYNDSAGRAGITLKGNPSATSNAGVYFNAEGYQEAWFSVIARAANNGNKLWRFGNLGQGAINNIFAIQKLTDDGSAISFTALSAFSNGNIGIGTTTNAGFKIDVNGTARVSGQVTGLKFVATNNGDSFMVNGFAVLDYGDGCRINYASGAQKVTIYSNVSGGGMSLHNSGNVSIGSTATEVTSAILNVPSTTKGFLPPRMTTTQKNAIASPATGLMVYDTTLNVITYFNGTTWV